MLTKPPHEADRDVPINDVKAGDEVVSIRWWTRQSANDLTYKDAAEAQTVKANRVIPLKMKWARVRQAGRRGHRDTGTKALDSACDSELEEIAQCMLEDEPDENDDRESEVGHGTDEDDDIEGM